MATPAEHYRPSPRPYRGLEPLDYPRHDWTATVTHCGRICFNYRNVNLSTVFAGQRVGVVQTDERLWLVSFLASRSANPTSPSETRSHPTVYNERVAVTSNNPNARAALTADQLAWVQHSEALWRRAHAIVAEHPALDAGDVYHALRCLELSPVERLRRGLGRGRLRAYAR